MDVCRGSYVGNGRGLHGCHDACSSYKALFASRVSWMPRMAPLCPLEGPWPIRATVCLFGTFVSTLYPPIQKYFSFGI